MVKTATCPDVNTLKKLAAADLPPAEMEPLLGHLQECDECLAKLPTFTGADTLVDALAKTKTLSSGPDDPLLAGLIERLTKLGQTPKPDEAAKSMKFSCTNCGKSLKVNTELVGKKVKCPGCAKALLVPAGVENFGPGGADKPGLDVSVEKTVPPDLQASKTAAKLAEERTVPPQGPDTKTGLSGVGQFTQMAPVPTGGDTEALDFLAPPQQPDELGRLERYRILKKLGAGGMGMVFLGEDTHLHRKVAIKVMLPQFAASTTAKERFLREARSAASIEHEHIVPIFQVDEDNNVPFLAMPFLKGEPLDVCLEREGKLPLPEALRIAKEMAEGLAAAHANNLIHRDIKPGNVWLEGKKAKVRLLDFGLARAQDDTTHLTQTGALVGTPAYMAPEQARGDKLDGRADLFSLGCVLYLMLTGQRPFKGNDTISLLMSLAVETPTLPTLMNPDVPDAVSDLTMRLLAKDAADRPESAQAVADELTALIDGEPSPIRGRVAPPKPGRSRGTARRKAPVLIAASVFLASILGGLIFFAPTIFRIATNQGELIVEVDDPDIEVVLKQEGVVVRDKTKNRDFVLTARAGQIEFLQEDVKLTTKTFELSRGGKTRVKVTAQEIAEAKKVAPPPVDVKLGDERQAAEAWLALGERNAVTVKGKGIQGGLCTSAKQLPEKPFKVVAISSTGKLGGDDGLAGFLKVFTDLESVTLRGADITSEAFRHFAPLPKLKNLLIWQGMLQGENGIELAHLKSLPNLETLKLNALFFAGSELVHVKPLTKLKLLDVGQAKINDADLVHLQGLTNLGVLDLSYANITDAGLDHLKKLTKLEKLDLFSTKVTPAGVAAFQKTLPKCQVATNFKSAPPPVTPKARALPFVLLRNGKEAGADRSFAELWPQYQAGDEIVVHGDGPFRLEYIQVKDRALVIKAAPGFRPVFVPDDTLFPNGPPRAWFNLTKAALTIEGCDLLMRDIPVGKLPQWLVSGGDGPCTLRNCRLLGFTNGLVPGATLGIPFQPSSVTIEDSLIVSSGMVFQHVPAGCEVTLTNNVIWAQTLFVQFSAPGGQKLRLVRNAIYQTSGNAFPLDPRYIAPGVSVIAEGNLFDFSGSAGGSISAAKTKTPLRELVRWQGKGNWYAGSEKAIADWHAALPEPEVNSQNVPRLPFAWQTVISGNSAKTLDWWKGRLADVRKQSGLDDLGPDLSLIGPGDAYLRGLEAEGRGVPKDKQRPEAAVGKRITLLRGGKDVNHFFDLKEAVKAAQDDDIIEIRTDAKQLTGVAIPKERKSLTLRAGPGYQPMLDSTLSASPETALVIEGLTFSGTAGATLSARFTRLAYCAFERGDNPDLNPPRLYVKGKDSGAEMLRCIVPAGTIILGVDEVASLQVNECILPRILYGEKDYGTIKLDKCIIAHTMRFSLLGRSVAVGKSKGQFAVRRCLFEGNGTLFHGSGETLPAWTGERNCYLLGEPFWYGGGPFYHSLAQWQALTKSPETGSFQGEPLFADPQRWRLDPGSPAFGFGPDVDKIARRAPGTAEVSQAGDDAWLKQVAALPANEQVEAVKVKLMQRNPGFDGKVTPTIDKTGIVTGLEFLTDHVTDIAPLRALVGLRTLKCNGSVSKGQLADLAPLRGMQLTSLVCGDSKVTDLSPLKDMKLISLDFGGSAVSDLLPLNDMSATLAKLWLFDTEVADLAPLKELKLTRLDCNGTKVSDLSPLKGMPLKSLNCDFNCERDGEILRSINTLETINGKSAPAFWKEAAQEKP